MPSSSASSRTSASSGVSPTPTLPPGKLPQSGHRLALRRGARDEHAIVAIDEGGGGDQEERANHGRGLTGGRDIGQAVLRDEVDRVRRSTAAG